MSSVVTNLKYRVPTRYLAGWGALAVLLLVIVITVPVTLHPNSLKIATALAGVLALASFGQMLVVMLGAIDLSVPAIVMVAAAMVVHYDKPGSNTAEIILATLAVTVLLSLLNWFLIAVLRLNAIIVTLGTLGIISGGVSIWTGVSFSPSGLAPKSLQEFTNSTVFNVSACFLVAILAGIVLALFLSKTRGGRQVAAIGSNRRAARLQGIAVTRIEFAAFVGVGLLYGVAGILIAGVVGTPDVSIGQPYQLLTITAVAIAGTAFNGGPSSVAGVVVACLFLQLLDGAMEIYGFSAGVRIIARGAALVLAVAALTLGQFAVAGIRRSSRATNRITRSDRGNEKASTSPAAHTKETT